MFTLRSATIRLISTLPVGSSTRRKLLSALTQDSKQEIRFAVQSAKRKGRSLEAILSLVARKWGHKPEIEALVKEEFESKKTAGRNTRHLVKALENYLKEIQRDSERELGKAWGKGGKYDPVADTGIWHGADVVRFSKSGADVVLHFDGAGYDYFSYNSPLRSFRTRVEHIAKKYGYRTEDINSWSMGFYQE